MNCTTNPNWIRAQQEKSKRIKRQKNERINAYLKSPKFCQQCSVLLDYKSRHKKFCNNSCAATYNNPRDCVHYLCQICDKRVPKGYRFCSKKCQAKHKREESVERFLKGQITHRPTIRYILLQKEGHRCKICSNIEWMNMPIPLELDHIDGNATNNWPDNLRLMCPNCHAQTPTFKARNKGNGRQARGLISR